MTHDSGNTYSIEVPANCNMIVFSNNGSSQSGNLKIPGDGSTYYMSSLSWDNNPGPTPTGEYVYYKNNSGWGSVNAYYWSDANITMTSWPGLPMEHVGNNVYKIVVPSEATMIIFNSNGQQTDNIPLNGYNKIYDNNQWYDYTG